MVLLSTISTSKAGHSSASRLSSVAITIAGGSLQHAKWMLTKGVGAPAAGGRGAARARSVPSQNSSANSNTCASRIAAISASAGTSSTSSATSSAPRYRVSGSAASNTTNDATACAVTAKAMRPARRMRSNPSRKGSSSANAIDDASSAFANQYGSACTGPLNANFGSRAAFCKPQ